MVCARSLETDRSNLFSFSWSSSHLSTCALVVVAEPGTAGYQQMLLWWPCSPAYPAVWDLVLAGSLTGWSAFTVATWLLAACSAPEMLRCCPYLPACRFWPVRKYPWGKAEALSSQHSDLAALRVSGAPCGWAPAGFKCMAVVSPLLAALSATALAAGSATALAAGQSTCPVPKAQHLCLL